MIIGCILASIGLNMFFSPHTIAPGGLSGLSVVLSKISGLSVSMIMLMLGIPLVFFSIKILGKKDAIKTLIGMFLLSFCINLTSPLSQVTVTNDVLLAAITGAIILGLGLGIIFRVDGSTGGTDLIALMINKAVPSIPLSKCLVCIDGLVVISSGLVNKNDNGRYIDRYRNRLMFPICDARGRVIAFGGRVFATIKIYGGNNGE